MFRVGTSCIFCSMNARSSSVTLNLICTVRFLPFIGSHSFPFRGFGTLPNKQFSTDAPQRRRAKIRKGYPFPMLAMKVFPYSLLQRKAPFCQTYAKEKRCNLKKITTLPKPIQFSFSTSAISFAVAVTIRMPLSLMLSSSVSSCRLCVDFSAVLSGKKNWSTDMS